MVDRRIYSERHFNYDYMDLIKIKNYGNSGDFLKTQNFSLHPVTKAIQLKEQPVEVAMLEPEEEQE